MRVKKGRIKISAAAEADYLADVALAANFDQLLGRAQAADQEFRLAQAKAHQPTCSTRGRGTWTRR